MRIAIVALGGVGGSTIISSLLANHIKSYGHHVYFLSLKPPMRLEKDITTFLPDDPVYPVLNNGEALLAEFATTLLNKIKRLELDTIHINYAFPFILAAPVIKSEYPSVKIVLTCHGTDITHFLQHSCYAQFFKTCVKHIDQITFVSNYLKQIFIKHCSHPNISVIPNFIDSITEPSFERDGLIHISNFRPVKQFERILKIHSLVNMKTKVDLHVIGNHSQHINSDGVIAHGIVENIFPILNKRKILLLTSESEGFGLAALEAMSCGIPVVSTKAGGIEELVKNNETGFLHEIGDNQSLSKMSESICSLLDDEKLYKRLSKNCISTVQEHFLAKQIVPRYLSIYSI